MCQKSLTTSLGNVGLARDQVMYLVSPSKEIIVFEVTAENFELEGITKHLIKGLRNRVNIK